MTKLRFTEPEMEIEGTSEEIMFIINALKKESTINKTSTGESRVEGKSCYGRKIGSMRGDIDESVSNRLSVDEIIKIIEKYHKKNKDQAKYIVNKELWGLEHVRLIKRNGNHYEVLKEDADANALWKADKLRRKKENG